MNKPVQKHVMENGIRIITEHMPFVRSVSVGAWILAGSRHEEARISGISHLMEHMVFKGTSRRSVYEIATSLESLGGHLNAYTEKEFTCFYAHVLAEDTVQAVDVLADLCSNAVLRAGDLENEIHVVHEEILNLKDTPEEYILDYLNTVVYPDNPLGTPILGTRESLNRIGPQELKDFYETAYGAENLIISAAGQIDHSRFTAVVEEHFRDFRTGIRPPVTPPDLGEDKEVSLDLPIAQSHLTIACPAFSYTDPRKYGLIVMNALLGGGMSSRLFQNLRELRGLAYSVYSFLDFWADTGLIGFYAGTSRERTGQALDALEEELDRMIREPVSHSELNRVKNQLNRSLILSMEDNTSRMNRLARGELYYRDHVPVDALIKRVEAVTPEQIQAAAAFVFRPENRYRVFMKPE